MTDMTSKVIIPHLSYISTAILATPRLKVMLKTVKNNRERIGCLVICLQQFMIIKLPSIALITRQNPIYKVKASCFYGSGMNSSSIPTDPSISTSICYSRAVAKITASNSYPAKTA
jgi:hypothetical protein